MVIRWKNLDGTESAGHPLPSTHAQALLRAFQEHFPTPNFWLETPPSLTDFQVPAPGASRPDRGAAPRIGG